MGLTFIAIVLLIAAWAALLLPDVRNRRSRPRGRDSIASFSRQLHTLDRARPGQRASADVVAFPQQPGMAESVRFAQRHQRVAPRSQAHARQRRMRVLIGLVGSALFTLVLAVLLSPVLIVVHLLVDAALGGYVWLLVEHRNRREERQARLYAGDSAEEIGLLRRTASGS